METAYYTYNAQGERIRKAIHNNSDIKIKEIIHLDGYEVYHEFASGSIDFERETLHIMDDQTMIAMAETLTIENGNPVTTPVTRLRYQISDHLGSGSIELSETGAIISFEEYYPYGGTSYHSTSSTSEVSAKRYRYNGKEKDEETNLYYYGARYYISWLGRWMNCDPLYDRYCSLNAEDRAGFDLKEVLNLYRYCLNNPVTYIDSKGMNSEEPQKKQLPEKKQEPVEKKKKEPVSNLVVDGDDTYKKDVIEALKKLDPTAEINMETGEVTVGKEATEGYEKGHELLSRIINNVRGHKVTIQTQVAHPSNPRDPFTENRCFTDKEGSIDPKKGSGSIVVWNEKNEVFVPLGDNVNLQRSTPSISLGHELIHAEHAIQGTKDMQLTTHTQLDGRRVRVAKEELRTIGIGGYNKKGDITENDLRKEKAIREGKKNIQREMRVGY